MDVLSELLSLAKRRHAAIFRHLAGCKGFRPGDAWPLGRLFALRVPTTVQLRNRRCATTILPDFEQPADRRPQRPTATSGLPLHWGGSFRAASSARAASPVFGPPRRGPLAPQHDMPPVLCRDRQPRRCAMSKYHLVHSAPQSALGQQRVGKHPCSDVSGILRGRARRNPQSADLHRQNLLAQPVRASARLLRSLRRGPHPPRGTTCPGSLEPGRLHFSLLSSAAAPVLSPFAPRRVFSSRQTNSPKRARRSRKP